MSVFSSIGLWSYLGNLEIDHKFANKRVLLFIHQTMRLSKMLLRRHNKDISLKIS